MRPAPDNVARSIPALLVAMRGGLTSASLPCFQGCTQWVGLVNCGIELKFLSLFSSRSKFVGCIIVALTYDFSDKCLPCVWIQGLYVSGLVGLFCVILFGGLISVLEVFPKQPEVGDCAGSVF